MQKFLTRMVLAVILACGCIITEAQASGNTPSRGVIRVKLQPEVALKVGSAPRMQAHGVVTTGVTPLDRAARDVKAISIKPMLPYAAKFARQRAKYGLDRWYVVSFDESVSPDEARKIFAATAGVEKSETVMPMSLKEGNGNFRKLDRSKVAKASAQMPFNDPFLPNQWHYQNFGTIPYSVEGADINLFEAWKSVTGSKDVLVAIIDGGVDYTHEDLAPNMYVNTAELNGKEGVDDDGNGYVDDIYGWNFCTNEPKIYPHSHGTHVAGTVAAVNNNGIGVAGVAGGDGSNGSGVKMISCQVFDTRSGTGEGDFAAALVYAAEKGATIAQCSWGWPTAGYYEQAVLDAIDYFTAEAGSKNMTGGLCIFAAGNEGKTGDFYPAAYEKVIGVTAMTSELTPASYSCNGPWADIVAPGGLMDYGEAQGVLSTLPNNEYGYNEGTSMATPHVAGVAALVLSKYGSPTFVNETLRTQLLTSVNDFYGYGNNSSVAGNFGTGYLDAAKAVRMDNDATPSAVGDFALLAAQDYITVTWIIPESSDNNVNSHIVYYSTEPFTADSDLTKLQRMVVDTKFLNSGDSNTIEIGNLANLTTYYVALQAVSRWGKASPLSPVKSVSTNAGPKMTVAQTSISLASTAAEPTASASITIGNEAEGILKWESAKRTVSAVLSSTKPNPGKTGPFKGKIASSSVKRSAVAAAPEYEADEYPQEIFYCDQLWAMIGETDKTLPNSMAQWFKVDPTEYPDGFNLTSLWFEAPQEGIFGANPVIEIYKGDSGINTASLLKTVKYQFFTYNYNIALDEQLYFAPGESFWVVAHFDAGQEGYPLSMGRTDKANIAGYSYMSTDNGKTWVQLSAALKGSSYESMAEQCTWAVKARSLNPDWSSFLELDPTSGTVLNGETQNIDVKADGRKLVNGTYKFNVNLSSNETDSKVKAIPATLKVEGNKPAVVVPKIVDFGSLLVGQTKVLTVEVYNKGYGSFRGSQWGAGIYSDNISSSSNNFSGPDMVQSGFPARATTRIQLTYCPTEAGSHHGTVSFRDMNGEEVKILVQGVATEPARLTVEPAVIDAGNLKLGEDPKEIGFTISNDGKYPLEFVFPKFSDEAVEGASGIHKFGYAVSSTLEGFQEFGYEPAPALINAVDITSAFNDATYITGPVSLGFSFPYYGKNYEKVYLTSFGGVMFAPNEATMRGPLTETSAELKGTGIICAYGRQLQMGPESKVEYAWKDGKFVINFTNVLALVYDQDYAPMSFHMSLSPTGDIELFYDDYENYGFFQEGSSLFCGINDPEMQDCVTITSAEMVDYFGMREDTPENTRYTKIASGTAVRFEAPQASFVRSLTPAYGLVSPGESVNVKAVVSVDPEMNAGQTYNNLAIVTNDPRPAVSAVRINAEILPDGLDADASVASTSIDFGKVFRTSDKTIAVTVKNSGHNLLTIQSADFDNKDITISSELPVTVKPGSSYDIVVVVPTATEGEVKGKLTVTTDVKTLTVDILGEVIGCPAADLSFEEITETIPSGTPLSKTLEINNSGNEPLEYSFKPLDGVKVKVPEDGESQTSYTYGASVDKKAEYAWEDIVSDGRGDFTGYRYYTQHDYITVDLPFEFPFYGKKYNKMYVYNTGFVSFTERRDDKIWPEPPAAFPNETVFTNIIAPYWGLHSMNTTKTAGTYHYVTEDRAVVSFMEYGNSMNYGVCYQLIMEKDGSFKFQYKDFDENSVIMSPFGLAGISNEDATNHIRLPERFITFGNAVAFTPVIAKTLAPGAKENVTIDINTDRMAGVYESELVLSTNVPGKENVSIPVNLTITGEAKPVIPETVEIENVMGFISTDYSDPLVQMGACYAARFEVANEGTAAFEVTNVTADIPMIEDPDFGYEFPAFNLWGKLPEVDWITGEPTGNYAWQDLSWGFAPQTIARTPFEIGVIVTQNEYWMTPGTYNVPVTVEYTTQAGGDPVIKVVNVKIVVTPAPSMTMDKEEIRVSNAADNHVSVETLTIGNEGEYKLSYSLSLDPTGVGEEIEDIGGGIAPWSLRSENLKDKVIPYELADGKFSRKVKASETEEVNPYDLPSDFEYGKALYYDAMPGNKASYNYGSGTVFDVYKEAVAFKAPADGINISHIYLPVATEDLHNAEIKIEIVSGNDPADAQVIGKGSFTIESQNGQGQFFVVALDKPVYMNPSEEFCVVVTYPEGIKYPSYLCVKEEPVTSGRYLGWVESAGWYDVAEMFEDQVGSIGYMLTCLETKAGEPWIKLITEETEGEIAVGEKKEVKVQVNAAAARLEKGNKAMIVIKGNDPAMPMVNFPVYLDMNSSPVIETASSKVYAKEGETTNISVSVFDEDGDDLTIRLTDNKGLAKITSVTPDAADTEASATIAEDGSATVKGATLPVKVNVGITPEFGDAGSYTFSIAAADKAGHETRAKVNYEVEKVNRAPIAADVRKITVKVGELSEVTDFASLFSDPDGDELTYSFSMPETELAEAFTTSTGVIFRGIAEGSLQATVTAVDPEGLTATAPIEVVISATSGIDEALADSGKLIALGSKIAKETLDYTALIGGELIINVFDQSGKCVVRDNVNASVGERASIITADLAPGVYVLHVTSGDISESYRFIR